MSKLEEIKEFYKDDRETAEHAGVGLILDDYDWLIERVKELESLVSSQLNVIGLYEELAHSYKQALEEIAQDTRTPYADIAIKALEGESE